MKHKAKTYVVATLKRKLEIWLDSIRKFSKEWTSPLKGLKTFSFAVPFYDKYEVIEDENGKKRRVYPNKVKRPDTVEIMNVGTDFFILVRKKEHVLMSVLAYNSSMGKYNLFISNGMTAKVGEKVNNKSHWLHLIIRRCLIVLLREKSIAEGGYRGVADKGEIRIDYIGLPVYFALVGIPLQRREQLPSWCSFNILAMKKYLASFKTLPNEGSPEMRKYIRSTNALKKLQKFRAKNEDKEAKNGKD